MSTTYQDVLDFWFGKELDNHPFAKEKTWWIKDTQFDHQIRERFSELWKQAQNGELKDWENHPESRLALVILLDQFSRNMFRNTPQAFSQDEYALRLTKDGLQKNMDQELQAVKRYFFYMPLEHSESLEDQNLCVKLFEKLYDESNELEKMHILDGLEYAKKHQVIIQKFGRFPHRNQIMGRTSTNEELAFLKTEGSSF